MKKYIRKLKVLIKVKTNEIHWFFIGCLCTIGYKELFLDRPYDIIDLMAVPFFGLLGGVVFYRWFTDDV